MSVFTGLVQNLSRGFWLPKYYRQNNCNNVSCDAKKIGGGGKHVVGVANCLFEGIGALIRKGGITRHFAVALFGGFEGEEKADDKERHCHKDREQHTKRLCEKPPDGGH